MGYDCTVREPVAEDAISGITYFHRNMWGMGELRPEMDRLGMLVTNYYFVSAWTGHPDGPYPPFPKYPGDEHFAMETMDGFIDGNTGDTLTIANRDEPKTADAINYIKELEKTLRWRPEVSGIPIHKLCDNSGWIVTAEECQEALEAYDRWIAEGGGHPEAFGDDFIPFLRTAAERDGFEVH